MTDSEIRDIVELVKRLAPLLKKLICGCSAPPPPPPPEEPTPEEPEEPEPEVPPPQPLPDSRALGANIGGVSDWTTEIAFLDAFKQARKWGSGTKGGAFYDNRPLDLDEHGWVRSLLPDQLARSFIFWSDYKPSFPAGEYVITYEGEGELLLNNHGGISSREPGRIVLQLDPMRGGLAFDLVSVNPDNHLRNIRVLKSTDVGTDKVFFQPFLDNLSPFGVLRLMDWGVTNHTPEHRWDDRPRPTDATYTTERGVPIEVMVALVNEAKIDPWFCMPHWADDAYVRSYAELVKATLAPERRVYIEHSNEVWNAQFPAFHYCNAKGREDRQRFGSNDFAALMNYHSARSVEIFKIWEDVFGGTQRLVRVLGAWAAVEWTSRAVLAFEDARAHTDAVAIAPYFGGGLGHEAEADRAAGLTLDQLMAELAERHVPDAITWMRSHAANAQVAGVQLFAYEAGQHLVGIGAQQNNAALNALFDAANEDARMRDLYLQYMNGWREAGGALLCNFSSVGSGGRFGRWGARVDLMRPAESFPKARALIEFSRDHPKWW